MSEQSSQERERPFLETKRILAGTAAAGVQASSVSVSPRVWGLGTIPRLHRPPQVGTKAESGQTERRESYTTCAVTTGAQTTIGQFSGNIYLECITARSCMIYMSGRAGQWFPPLPCEQCRLQGQRKYKVAGSLVTLSDGVTGW